MESFLASVVAAGTGTCLQIPLQSKGFYVKTTRLNQKQSRYSEPSQLAQVTRCLPSYLSAAESLPLALCRRDLNSRAFLAFLCRQISATWTGSLVPCACASFPRSVVSMFLRPATGETPNRVRRPHYRIVVQVPSRCVICSPRHVSSQKDKSTCLCALIYFGRTLRCPLDYSSIIIFFTPSSICISSRRSRPAPTPTAKSTRQL